MTDRNRAVPISAETLKELTDALEMVDRWDEISGLDAEWTIVMKAVRAALARLKS